MKSITKSHITNYYSNINKSTDLKKVFEKTLVKFVEFHHSGRKGTYGSLFCNIHDNFKNGHNCVACNLNDSNRRIENFLYGYRLFNDVHTAFTTYILLLYLQVECIFEYFSIIQIPETYVLKHFQTFYTVKRWANFLKHPKAFILVHHPIWEYKNDKSVKKNEKKPIIDTEFVKKFYGGDSKNNELLKILNNQEDVIVLFPNPVELMDDFNKLQEKFADLISNNQIVREILNDKATILNFFEVQGENNQNKIIEP